MRTILLLQIVVTVEYQFDLDLLITVQYTLGTQLLVLMNIGDKLNTITILIFYFGLLELPEPGVGL